MKLIEDKLKTIEGYYNHLISLSEEIEKSLHENKMIEVEHINKKEMMAIFDLRKQLDELGEIIEKECETHEIKIKKIRSLFPFMLVEEQERIKLVQRNIMNLQSIWQNKVKNNEMFIRSKVAFSEILHNSIVQQNEQNGINNNLYNKKY